ncbi:MAG: pilus assembly protein [Alphaproteobacteria bacterium]|nr:pilus assembly protein [Alphaproteobacteria bacterium]
MLSRAVKGYARSEKATAAIEFALVGLPFIIMLVGFVEICLFFAAAMTLEGGAEDAARMIRTGQVQSSGNPLQTFETEMCNQVSSLLNCGNLQYEVIPITDNAFSNAANMTPQFDQNGNLENQGFDPGNSNDDVLVRVVYRYTFLTPFLGNIITGSASSQATLISTIYIKNEPYVFGN